MPVNGTAPADSFSAAERSYLTFYPALFLYLWSGTNLLDAAGTLTVGFMAAGVANGVWRLRRAMD